MGTKASKKDMQHFIDQCASFNFRKAARATTQLFDTALQPVGLRSTQLIILLAAGVHETTTMSELADIIVTDRTTLTRGLRPLVNKGYLKNITGKDKRKTGVELTDKGHQIILKSVPYWQQAQGHIVKSLGAKQWEDLRLRLNKASSVVKKHSNSLSEI
jgi:DNA-binding MarR family transcriptional regulator